MQLVAGPDLLTTTIEPHEMLDFASGRFARRVIGDPEALDLRLRQADLTRDGDWRFRVNDFFCTQDSWRAVVVRVVTGCDVVFMDLRNFSERHAGCAWEIGAVVHLVPIARLVIVVNDATDEPFLFSLLGTAFAQMPPGSPNAGLESSAVHFFRFADLRRATLRDLLEVVARAAAAPDSAAPAADAALKRPITLTV